MNHYEFVGIDIAKAKFDAYVQTAKTAHSSIFENNSKGFKHFLSWLKKHTSNPWVCLEATGCYGEGVAEFLVENKIMVSVINPMQIKNYSKAILSRNKNDELDAKIIALYAKSATSLREYKPRNQAEKELKEAVQLIEMLENQKQRLQNQLKENVQCQSIKIEFKKIIRSLEVRLIAVEAKLKKLIQENTDFSKIKNQLISIVGIGEKTIQRLLAYLPDISTFQTPKQLAAFAGLSPRQHQSGTFKGKTKLSKFGNSNLRKSLYMPALVVKNHNKSFKIFCERLEKNGLAPKAIVCAVMRKLIHIIFGMLKSGQEFNPDLV